MIQASFDTLQVGERTHYRKRRDNLEGYINGVEGRTDTP